MVILARHATRAFRFYGLSIPQRHYLRHGFPLVFGRPSSYDTGTGTSANC